MQTPPEAGVRFVVEHLSVAAGLRLRVVGRCSWLAALVPRQFLLHDALTAQLGARVVRTLTCAPL